MEVTTKQHKTPQVNANDFAGFVNININARQVVVQGPSLSSRFEHAHFEAVFLVDWSSRADSAS